MFQKYNILKKVIFKIKSKEEESFLPWFCEKYNNISIFPEKSFLKVELLLDNSEINSLSLEKFRKMFGDFTITSIKKKNWISQNIM